MDPGTLAAAGALGGGIMSGLGSLFGGDAQAKAVQRYIDWLNSQRNLFLEQPEVGSLRQVLGRYATGTVGYDPQALEGIRANITEDYGRGLQDLQTQYGLAGVQPGSGGAIYRPGAQARTLRLLGENLNVRRAEANRALAMQNEQQKIANLQFAASALPTYLPGIPATPTFSPQTFAAAQPPPLSAALLGGLGQGLSAGANLYAMSNMFPQAPPANAQTQPTVTFAASPYPMYDYTSIRGPLQNQLWQYFNGAYQ